MVGPMATRYTSRDQWLGPALEVHRFSYAWAGQGEPLLDLSLSLHLIPFATWLLSERGRVPAVGALDALHLRVESLDHVCVAGRIKAPGGWSGFSAEIAVTVDDSGNLVLEETRAHLPDPLPFPGPVPSLWPLNFLLRSLPAGEVERLGPHRVRIPLMTCLGALFEEAGLTFPALPSAWGVELSFHRLRLGLRIYGIGAALGAALGAQEGGEAPAAREPEAPGLREIFLGRIDHALAYGHWNEAAEAWEGLKRREPDLLFGLGHREAKRRWLWLAEATGLVPEALHRVRQLVYTPEVGLEALGALSRHHRQEDAPIRAMLYLRQAWDSTGEEVPTGLARWAAGQSLLTCLRALRSPEASRVGPVLDQLDALYAGEAAPYAEHAPPPMEVEAEEGSEGEEAPAEGEGDWEEAREGQGDREQDPEGQEDWEDDREGEGDREEDPEGEGDWESEGDREEDPEGEEDQGDVQPDAGEAGREEGEDAPRATPQEEGADPLLETSGDDWLLDAVALDLKEDLGQPLRSEEEEGEGAQDVPSPGELDAFRQVLGEAASLYGLMVNTDATPGLGPTPREGHPRPGASAPRAAAPPPGEATPVDEDFVPSLAALRAAAEEAGAWAPYLKALEAEKAAGSDAPLALERALAEAHLAMGVSSRAEAPLGAILDAGPTGPDFDWAEERLRGILQDGGRVGDLIALEGRLIEAVTPGAAGLTALRALADDARRQDQGRVEGEILHRILALDPEDAITLERLDALLKARGAWRALADLWGAQPGERAVLRRAEALAEAGDLPGARALLTALIEDHPNQGEARRSLDAILRLQGEAGLAGPGVGGGADLDLPEIEQRLARLETQGGDLEPELEAALDAHLKAHPADRRGVHAMIRVHALKGTLEDAVTLLTSLSREGGQPSPMRAHWLRELGDVYLVHLGDPDRALAFYEQADALGGG